jgi:hypothetical protein
MLNAKQYRQYVTDCIRIADKMNGDDKQTLLKIAEAWMMRALLAEKQEKKSGEASQPFHNRDHGRGPNVRST